jgi:hypothetical protein
MAFPDLVPTARSFDPGNWPVREYRAQNGAEVRLLYGSKRTGMKLSLSYDNISDTNAELFLHHFNETWGTYNTFVFDGDPGAKAGWGGSPQAIGAEFWGNRWRYAEPPKVVSVRPGRSSVTVNLIGVF